MALESGQASADRTAGPYRTLLQDAPKGAAILRLGGSLVATHLQADDAYAGAFGFRGAELRGVPLLALARDEDREATRDAVRTLVSGRATTSRVEQRRLGEDGATRWNLLELTTLASDPGGLLGLARVIDITAYKSAAIELATLRRRSDVVERRALIGSFAHDRRTDTLWWSPGCYRVLGRDPTLGPPSPEEYRQAVHPDDRGRLDEAMRETQHEDGLEYRVRRGDGTTVMIRATFRPVHDHEGRLVVIEGTVQDVTRERALEQRIADAELDKAVFRALPGAHLLVALEAGVPTILGTTAAADAQLGQEPQTLAGAPLDAILPRGDGARWLGFAVGGGDVASELEVALPDDETRRLRASVVGVTASSPMLLVTLGGAPARSGGAGTTPELTSRELGVLQLVADGQDAGEIGRALHLSGETVRGHLRRIYLKLRVNDRAAAVAVALRAGLID